MGAPIRPVTSTPAGRAWLLPAGLFALPLLAALALALGAALDAAAWRRLLDDPALWPALSLGVWVGAAATVVSLALTLWIVTHLHGSRAWAFQPPRGLSCFAVACRGLSRSLSFRHTRSRKHE